MTKDEALKMDVTQAIDFLYSIPIEYSLQPIDHDRFENAVDVLSKALEQPAQEPVAWIDKANNTITTIQLMKYGWLGSDNRAIPDAWIKLYTHPAQPCQECENLKHDLESYMEVAHAYANQKPLSDDAIAELWGEKWSGSTEMIKNFARAIEKAHGIGEWL